MPSWRVAPFGINLATLVPTESSPEGGENVMRSSTNPKIENKQEKEKKKSRIEAKSELNLNPSISKNHPFKKKGMGMLYRHRVQSETYCPHGAQEWADQSPQYHANG